MASNTAHLADPMREFVRPVEQIKRREIVRAADIILPTVAGAKENAAVVAHRRLGCLHVDVIGVQRDLAGDGNATLVGAEIVVAGLKAKGRRNAAKPGSGAAVEEALGRDVVGHGPAKVERGGHSGHGGGLRERTKSSRRLALAARRARLAPGPPL